VECGADSSRGDNEGLTPLHLSAQDGNVQCIRCLVKECGADPSRGDNEGLTPLHWATQRGHVQCVRCLVVECGASTMLARPTRVAVDEKAHVVVFEVRAGWPLGMCVWMLLVLLLCWVRWDGAVWC
jgi:hypothetical protein